MEVAGFLVVAASSAIFFWVITVLYSWFSPCSLKELERIPGSLGLPFIGESLSFVSEFSSPSGIYTFIKKRHQKYGKVFKTSVLGRWTVFMTGNDASKILLSGKDGIVSLNLFYAGKQVMGPTSLLQTTGSEHKRLRQVIGEPLSVEAMKKYLPFINSLAEETLDGWAGRRVLVLEEASTFTLKVISNILMSLQPTGAEQEKFRANFKVIASALAALPLKIPGFALHRGIKARDRMYSMLDSIIARRRTGEEVKHDFLQSLLMKHSKEANAEEAGDKLTDTQLKDNILTLLIAGHDTTTAAITWILKFLEENPSALQSLREEHMAIEESRKEGTCLTWSDIRNMPFTIKVISETLRKATILPWFSRKAAQDFKIDGYNVKKGWSVNLDVVSIHHDPEIFPDPENFDPSRFDKPLKPFSYLGFGSGPRMCPGINLAKLEICIFIHHFICRYRWRTLEKDETMHPTLVRMPNNKYPIVVERI